MTPSATANRPHRLDREIVADRIVHALGLAAGLVGGAILLARAAAAPAPALLPVTVYVAGLLAMLGCSAAYHLGKAHRHRDWLRRLDHAAIFVMIAGTYTPLAALGPGGPWTTAVLAAVWIVAGAGVVLKLARPRAVERASLALYLVQGWLGLFALAEFLGRLPASTVALIVTGGVVYSAGTLFHVSSRRYGVALWHGSVLLGAACHYAAIASLIRT